MRAFVSVILIQKRYPSPNVIPLVLSGVALSVESAAILE
jgi:hypothetical protein